ncbi:Rab11A, rab family GTPase [Mucor mucedo]|uniref:Rab11A, rab family GTPase n=1 Tax=Mucor mucedo TaxID=29922 RepID=UPI0022210172|nr:Rab11A, rab family GTPase [Mucor mucedo]KAI7893642.1 Rab11A, rab family GTPase [Mucor mucedo]
MATVEDESSYDYVFKLVVVGDSGVGKTNLLGRFVHDTFDFASKSTIGLDLTIKNMVVKGKRVRAQIWDTAGQERYRSITKRYYRGSVGALLVYDITKRDSFSGISRWLNELRINEAHPDSIIMLIGNKSDLEKDRAVTQEEAMDYAKKNGLMFMETSALDNVNVETAFETLIYNIFDKLSGKLTTMDDKRAEIMRGQAIQLSTPADNNGGNKSSSCAC